MVVSEQILLFMVLVAMHNKRGVLAFINCYGDNAIYFYMHDNACAVAC